MRLGLGHHLALVGNVLRRKLAHFLFDALEVFGRERLVAHEIVEKSGVDRRTDTQLHVWKKFQHRRGEQMRGRVPQHLNRVRIFRREDRKLYVLINRRAQIDQKTFAVGGGGQARFRSRVRRFFGIRARDGRGRPLDRRDPGDQRLFSQARRNLLRDFRGGGAERHFAYRAIRHRNVNHIHNVVSAFDQRVRTE